MTTKTCSRGTMRVSLDTSRVLSLLSSVAHVKRIGVLGLIMACGPALDDNEDTASNPTETPPLTPLYDGDTLLEAPTVFARDGAIVTRFADRGRDRHAREDEFQSYDHYLPRYWEYRTARVQLVDTVASGGSTIDVSIVTEWKLSVPEFRAWYLGTGTVATYGGNYAGLVTESGPGTFDEDHKKVGNSGTQYRYTLTIDHAILIDKGTVSLETGQFMEMEISQFLAGVPSGRANYYGTAILYEVGVGGLVPWEAMGSFSDPSSQRENSTKLDEAAWLGGRTTLPYQYSDEPDSHYMQMATNISGQNGQPFVLGRRVHHTDMVDGSHDESPENGTFSELVDLAGPHYIKASCDGCHQRNGRASVADEGEVLDRWVFKVATEEALPDPDLGRVLQVRNTGEAPEGQVVLEGWDETEAGLRVPRYEFIGKTPERFSARLTPSLIGMGLLEAIPQDTILDWADPDDSDADGVSGRVQVGTDPETGEMRLGRFGWKAGTISLRHQVASALNTDMGVMTTVMDTPDCGTAQDNCGNEDGPELSESHFENLVKYVALLGVRARRDLDDATALEGEAFFKEIGCASCHRATVTTSPFHPYAELRSQTIHPYTDLLLHDMGPELADTLGEGVASGAEWRTAPLWGIGLNACVTGGVDGPNQNQTCVPDESYLHDGRARTLHEAILWHGGEGEAARNAYLELTSEQQGAVQRFLNTL